MRRTRRRPIIPSSKTWRQLCEDAPTRPGETCPSIDSLQGMAGGSADDLALIRAQMKQSKSSTVRDLSDDMMNVESTLSSIRLSLEELRASNEALRTSSRYWYGVAKALHAEQQKIPEGWRIEANEDGSVSVTSPQKVSVTLGYLPENIGKRLSCCEIW